MFLAYLFALLAPFEQSVHELTTILEDQRLSELLGSSTPIERVYRKSDGYIVVTKEKMVEVKIIHEKSDRIGPKSFHLEYGKVKKVSTYKKSLFP
jgi:hypothetical protein